MFDNYILIKPVPLKTGSKCRITSVGLYVGDWATIQEIALIIEGFQKHVPPNHVPVNVDR